LRSSAVFCFCQYIFGRRLTGFGSEKNRFKIPFNNMKCPICDREFIEDAPVSVMPFCSKRCKIIDAGRWLGEKYGLPIEDENDNIENDPENWRQ
jgi:endogenous inhibitor of DNA gyrase (YacG/DUF329 family)